MVYLALLIDKDGTLPNLTTMSCVQVLMNKWMTHFLYRCKTEADENGLQSWGVCDTDCAKEEEVKGKFSVLMEFLMGKKKNRYVQDVEPFQTRNYFRVL